MTTLAAVQSDDALLDMLGSAVVVTDDELSRVLYAWRRDVDAEPIGVLVALDTAVAVIEANKPAQRLRPFGAVTAVFAVLIIAFCALCLAAVDAHPGEWLWPLHQFLYPLDGSR